MATPSITQLEAQLVTAPAALRRQKVLHLAPSSLAELYEWAGDVRTPLSLAALVPSSVPPMAAVVHEGLNSLLAFRRFAKVFCRPATAGPAEELWGYNRTHPALLAFAGPGYFTVRVDPRRQAQLRIDYQQLPTSVPPQWPPLRANRGGLRGAVYGGLSDTLRPVCDGICIGRAFRHERALDTWFVLHRDTAAESSSR